MCIKGYKSTKYICGNRNKRQESLSRLSAGIINQEKHLVNGVRSDCIFHEI